MTIVTFVNCVTAGNQDLNHFTFNCILFML